MELPEVGKHCSWNNCKRLDFLPFTCDNCQQIFCREHRLTSAHDCKCLNEFFKKKTEGKKLVFHSCNKENCTDRSALELLCSHCNLHFCVSHRHHGCDDLNNKERRKAQVEQWKKPKEQFKAAKAEADKKVEQALRRAQATQLQPLALKVRLMKLKSKALGDNKIPTDKRLYFAVSPPWRDEISDYKPIALFTSKDWTVGRTIDLFASRLKIVNKNNESNEAKLRLFTLSNGTLIAKTTDTVLNSLVGDVIQNGDSLILNYVKVEDLSATVSIDEENLQKYRLAAIN